MSNESEPGARKKGKGDRKWLPLLLLLFSPPLGHHEARGLLSTSASIEPVTPALESGILTIGPPGKPYEGPLLAMSTRGIKASLVAQRVKHLPAMQETWVPPELSAGHGGRP